MCYTQCRQEVLDVMVTMLSKQVVIIILFV